MMKITGKIGGVNPLLEAVPFEVDLADGDGEREILDRLIPYVHEYYNVNGSVLGPLPIRWRKSV